MEKQMIIDYKTKVSIYAMVFVLLFREVLLLRPSTQFLILLFIGIINLKRIDRLGIMWYGGFTIVTIFSYIVYDYMDPISTLLNTLLYLILCCLLLTQKTYIDYCFHAFTILGTILFAYFLIHYKDILGHGRLGDYMYDTNYGSSIGLSYYIIAILCTALICYIKNAVSLIKIISIVCIILGFSIAIFNGAKKAYMIPVVFLLIYTFLKDKNNFFKLLFRLSILSLVIMIIWNYLKDIDLLQRYFIDRVEAMFAAITEGGGADDDGSTTARMRYIPVAWNAFLDNPIFGMGGLGSSCAFFRQTIHVSHPHNDFLNLLAAGGVFLFVIFYWFPFKVLFLLYKQQKSNGAILMLTLIVSLLFNNLNSTTFNIPVINVFYIVAYNYYILDIKESQYAGNLIRY